MPEVVRQILDLAKAVLLKLGCPEFLVSDLLAGIILAIVGFILSTLVIKPVRSIWQRLTHTPDELDHREAEPVRPLESDLQMSDILERDYLRWLANEVKTISRQWHETPIVPTPAHRKRPLGWRERWRTALFRHDPLDYTLNPALNDVELSVRAGFGRRVRIRDLAKELRKFPKVVVLGDPGSGKSVCLRQLAYDLAQSQLDKGDDQALLPIFVGMGAYDGWRDADARQPTPILEFLKQELQSHDSVRDAPTTHPVLYVSQNLENLLRQGRVVCILDALDEMPQDGYQERYQCIKKFMTMWEAYGNRFVYSCRTLDYDSAFNVGEVIIDPFDRQRIWTFLKRHVPRRVAEALYQRIVEDESLEQIVSNPFFLQALAYISAPSSEVDATSLRIPATRGQLIRGFAETLLRREAQEKQREFLGSVAGGLDTLRRFLSELAFVLQERRGGGTSVQVDQLGDIWGKYPEWEELLWISRRARILGKRGVPADQLPDTPPSQAIPMKRVEFIHHRLQEFFAAEELARRLADGDPLERYLEDIWWHEAVVLAIGTTPDPHVILGSMLSPRADTNSWIRDVVVQAEKPIPEDAVR